MKKVKNNLLEKALDQPKQSQRYSKALIKAKIMNMLNEGYRLSNRQLEEKFKVPNTRILITELRNEGHPIITQIVRHETYKHYFAVYYLDKI